MTSNANSNLNSHTASVSADFFTMKDVKFIPNTTVVTESDKRDSDISKLPTFNTNNNANEKSLKLAFSMHKSNLED